MKFQIGDDIKFSLSAMKRVVDKVRPLMGTDPNILAIQDGLQLKLFRHTRQIALEGTSSGLQNRLDCFRHKRD
jgi:hypothetical protein